jgi:hypothetical protein
VICTRGQGIGFLNIDQINGQAVHEHNYTLNGPEPLPDCN